MPIPRFPMALTFYLLWFLPCLLAVFLTLTLGPPTGLFVTLLLTAGLVPWASRPYWKHYTIWLTALSVWRMAIAAVLLALLTVPPSNPAGETWAFLMAPTPLALFCGVEGVLLAWLLSLGWRERQKALRTTAG